MLKSMLFRLWLMGFAALIAMLTPGAAVAEPIIVIISSQHNLEYARRACSYVKDAEGIAECKFVGDGRNLGRKLENEVRSGMATNPRCQGVDVFRQNHPDYDGKINFDELADQMKQVHWTLFLEYNPGQTTHNWTLFLWTGGDVSGGELVPSGTVEGEGTGPRLRTKFAPSLRSGAQTSIRTSPKSGQQSLRFLLRQPSPYHLPGVAPCLAYARLNTDSRDVRRI